MRFTGSAHCWTALLLGVLLAAAPVHARAMGSDGDEWYRQGRALYEQGHFQRAVHAFEQAAAVQPSSRNYHWLGKSYGQLAERATLIEALRLAQQTRRALEQAVELDTTNRDAVADLMEYYAQAPAIVGGDPEKAERLRRHVADLEQRERGDAGDHAGGDS